MPAWGIAPELMPFLQFELKARFNPESRHKTGNESRFQRFELAITSSLGRCPMLTR